jgi:hypothetical protein
VDILFKDDVTVILLPGVSFVEMAASPPGLSLRGKQRESYRGREIVVFFVFT